MGYPFPPDVAKVIQERLQSGEYPNEDDVIREALRALDEREFVVLQQDTVVVEGIRRGLADMKAGRSQPVEDFDKEFRAKHNLPGHV